MRWKTRKGVSEEGLERRERALMRELQREVLEREAKRKRVAVERWPRERQAARNKEKTVDWEKMEFDTIDFAP